MINPFPSSPCDWHSCRLFVCFFSLHRTLNNTKVIGSPESISHNFANTLRFFCWCVGFFLMTQYVFCDQGQFRREDGKGERIGKHTLTHTLTRALWVVCLEHLCVLIEKESNTKSSLSFFCFIPQPRGDTPLFPANIPPLWILIPARERTGPLKCSAREAVRHRAGHHSSVKGVVLTCCPSYQSTFVKYVCIVASAEIHRHINNYCSTPPSPPPCDIHTSEPKW